MTFRMMNDDLSAEPSDRIGLRTNEDVVAGAIPRPLKRNRPKKLNILQVGTPSLHVVNTVDWSPDSGRPILSRSSPRSPIDPQKKTPSNSKSLNARTDTGSSSSPRLLGNTSKTTRALNKQFRPLVPRGSDSSPPVPRNDAPVSLAYRSHGLEDGGLGIRHGRQATESSAQSRVGLPVRPVTVYPELDRYHDFLPSEKHQDRQDIDVSYRLATQNPLPPTPVSLWFPESSQASAMSGSPSPKLSGSPRPGRSYSRDTTPTSMSSQSPDSATPSRVPVPCTTPRQHSASSNRPPVTRRCAGSSSHAVDLEALDPTGLASVRESLASSSSNSTVKEGTRKAYWSRLPPSPSSPSPSLRSKKLRQSKDVDVQSKLNSLQHDRNRELLFNPQSPRRQDASPLSRSSPPVRPRRNDMPDMNSHFSAATPIIQSNLKSTVRGTKIQGGKCVGPKSPAWSATSLLQTRNTPSTSSLPCHEHERASSYPNSPSGAALRFKGASEPVISAQRSRANAEAPPRTRFPFFGRRKLVSDGATKFDEKAETKSPVRKGPMAGTGHEGYGRIGTTHRRRGSDGSALTRKATNTHSSPDSSTSSDTFLADRVNPVIILGGEVADNGNRSFDISRPELGHAVSLYSDTNSILSSEGLPLPRLVMSSPNVKSSLSVESFDNIPRPSDKIPSRGIALQSALAFRRSMRRLRSVPDAPLQLPQPINTACSTSRSTSFDDTGILSPIGSLIEPTRAIRGNPSALHPAQKKYNHFPLSPLKWKFFRRAQDQVSAKVGKKKEQIAANANCVDHLSVTCYNTTDAIEQDEGAKILHVDAEGHTREENMYPQPAKGHPATDSSFAFQSMSTPRHRDQSPQQSRQSSAKVSSIDTASSSAVDDFDFKDGERSSQLDQLDRYPQVVKKIGHKSPSPRSFSQPFRAGFYLRSKNAKTELYDTQSIETTISMPLFSPNTVSGFSMDHTRLNNEEKPASDTYSSCVVSPNVRLRENDLLAFSPPPGSDCTMHASLSNPGLANPFATATAVVPNTADPPFEDEVWDEYNDLLDGECIRRPPSTASSDGVPFHLEVYQDKLKKQEALRTSLSVSDTCKDPARPKVEACTDVNRCSAGMMESKRFQTALQQLRNPPANQLPSAALAEHERSNGLVHMERASGAERNGSSSFQTILSDCGASSANDGTPLPFSEVSLRVGSMTVSKWLTFGHVLFGEIRHQLPFFETLANSHSILVIDGLGNDDWSFYAAETYPSISVFNLSPRPPAPTQAKKSWKKFPSSPTNHHQIRYTSHLDQFPFASQTFDAVVYRFPAVAPESHHRNILREARRVLRPGGYIELSILDFDFNGMGGHAQRTVRHLRAKIQLQNSAMNLRASTADLITRLLGNVGYADIKTARIGIPVTGSLSQNASQTSKTKSGLGKDDHVPGMAAELRRDESLLADDDPTKIVSRVGRWWYSRCYENAAGFPQDKSIWNDACLLSECEQFGTSMKLTICSARAPDRFASF
ncbi:hypothetical protein E4U17_004760 [Claviceps sp. LM77 group G4]|nr:hypothetical protein E4U17_004760 [Claviceps sp. LM77 group G4]KAG6069275.1 hypothetical protein E4U16_007750 [Claviceps sp. LM84 group G4]KAG6074962.1 hypothetical protein E4U33_002250 [Claviceps sp. LM78 group G4]